MTNKTKALEEFDRFCRFIDGMHMGGFVENDFMSKPIQKLIRAALSSPQWEPIESAPRGTRVLVYGNGPCRTGYRDDLGNWRALHHGPLKTQPTHWMPLPLPPAPKGIEG